MPPPPRSLHPAQMRVIPRSLNSRFNFFGYNIHIEDVEIYCVRTLSFDPLLGKLDHNAYNSWLGTKKQILYYVVPCACGSSVILIAVLVWNAECPCRFAIYAYFCAHDCVFLCAYGIEGCPKEHNSGKEIY